MTKYKKTIFTLNVDNYAPNLTEYTYPLMQRYADKIGADFYIIKDRKYPNMPPVYEKMQIYELGKKMGNDWNIYVDSDALIHPDFFDVTEFLNKDTVCHNGADMANNRWKYDKYFQRDKRHIGSCNWMTIASDWCIDLWTPLEIPLDMAVKNIYPIQNELNTVITPDHLIDDYTLSRNIAKFGLKFTTITKILEQIQDQGNYLWHQYTISIEEKEKDMRRVLANWGVCDYKDRRIEGWLSYNEMVWLYLTAQKMDSIVEIGSWKGRSAHAMASACKGKVYLIDDFQGDPVEHPEVESDLRKNMAEFSNVEIIKARSLEAASKFKDKSIDMVFIDGAHDRQSVFEDIQAWYPKAKKIVCGHDYNEEGVRLGVLDANILPIVETGSVWSVDKQKLIFDGR